jgi:CHAD domain-containing protein
VNQQAKANSVNLPTKVHLGEASTIGQIAHHVIAHEFQHLMSQETGVISDRDPEYLHQMRVAARRLRTALLFFAPVIVLPPRFTPNKLQQIGRRLGTLRDLDVQIQTLLEKQDQPDYASYQRAIASTLQSFSKKRRAALQEVLHTLSGDTYKALKHSGTAWIESPQLTTAAALSTNLVLPDLMLPGAAELFLHPAWLMRSDTMMDKSLTLKVDCLGQLHDLRKLCKRIRYQGEFLKPHYGKSLKVWVTEIKGLQELLGQVQDATVLLNWILKQKSLNSDHQSMITLVTQEQLKALEAWQPLQQRYCDAAYRRSIYTMLLNPGDCYREAVLEPV